MAKTSKTSVTIRLDDDLLERLRDKTNREREYTGYPPPTMTWIIERGIKHVLAELDHAEAKSPRPPAKR